MLEQVWQSSVGFSVGSAITANLHGAAADRASQPLRRVDGVSPSACQTNCDHQVAVGDRRHLMPRPITEIWRVMSRTLTPLVAFDGMPSGAWRTSGIGKV